MSRHNARIIGIMTLFNMDMLNLKKEDTYTVLDDILKLESEEEYPVKIDIDYAKELVEGIINNLEEIDELISKYLVNYTLDRLSYVDRAIIRLCSYEMKYLGLNKSIAINEAIEITKEYSSVDMSEQVKFTNRVLDNIAFGISTQNNTNNNNINNNNINNNNINNNINKGNN